MRFGYRLCLAMKLAILILMMSVASLSASRAEDASARNLQSAQANQSKPDHQPAGSCTPIGLTANGDIVFPWDCRETIEKQRGPITVNLPKASNDLPSHDQAQSPDVRKEDTVATAATAPARVEETVGRAAASPPEVSAASALAKPRLPPRRVSDLARPDLGHKAQQAALHLHPEASGAANAKKKDKVASQPAATPK